MKKWSVDGLSATSAKAIEIFNISFDRFLIRPIL